MKIEVNIDKKYFFILLGVLIVIGGIIGVYAVLGATPNPGHPIADLQKCTVEGETLKIVGGVWTCATANSGSSYAFGGMYGIDWDGATCKHTNPYTNACSCPTGYTAQKTLKAAQYAGESSEVWWCYKI